MRSMYPADPTFMHGSSESQKFISLENFSVARFCGIFEDLKNPKFHFILKIDFLKLFCGRLCWKRIFKQKGLLERIYMDKIKRKVFDKTYLH